jgi:hypothetical protein
MLIPNKVIINGEEVETQKLCPNCNVLLQFGIQPTVMSCMWYCQRCDYVSTIETYENVPPLTNVPWRQ